MSKSIPLSHIGELRLIEKIQKQVSSSSSVLQGIGDDTAVVRPSAQRLLLTTDMLVEGVHFRKTTAPELIGRKALAVNLSDIAAMGGIPRYAVISIGISPRKSVSYMGQLYKGIERLARSFNVSVVGGDTVKSQKTVVNIALTGEVPPNHLVKRTGAKAGDRILVTGPLGNAFKSGHHLRFTPRLAESRFLVKYCKPTAMIDISDGLSSDLFQILRSSKVSAVISQDDIPLRKGATCANAFRDGEDFELLFTLPPQRAERLLAKRSRFSFYPIGEITSARSRTVVLSATGKKILLRPEGYAHF
jgi:thiamine-monophosphate kinase